MGRTKGSKNKNTAEMPMYTALPTEERLFVVTNLIVNRIVEDQQTGAMLLKQLVESGEARLRNT
jgi:hypothetical protein